LADVAKELILAGKVKLHGSMAQAKVIEPESNLLVYSPDICNADCDKNCNLEVSTFITSIYMPTNSAVLHRFIADKVRNCQVFNPIVSFSKLSQYIYLGLHCAKVCQVG
jgi:hypothetical protein